MIDYEFCRDCETVCPYCKNKEQYSGDSLGNNEETEEVCSNCKKTFIVRCVVSADHECYPKESLV